MPPPKPYIAEHDHFGKLKVGFTRPLVLPTFGRYPEFTEEEYYSKNCTNGGLCEQQKNRRLEEQKIDFEQEMKEAIEIVNHGLIWENNTYNPIVRVSVIPGIESDPSWLNFTWICTNFTNLYMDFDLFYEFVDFVSINDYKERIKVDFIGKDYFSADDG